jgi:glycosyltransferase involved in cell wall biosynthesis
MSKKTLYISYDGMTDALGRSQVLPYLEGLGREGYSITLISAEKAVPFQQDKLEVSALIEKMGINWKPVSYTKRPPVISTVWDIFKIRRKAFELYYKESFAIIHCRSYISAFIGLAMKNRFGCRFIFDMRGFYADERVDGQIWPLSNPVFKLVYKYFKKKEKLFLNRADAIVTLTHAAKSEILSWRLKEVNDSKISVIPCCADLDLFNYNNRDEESINDWKSKLNINPTTFILSYLGSIGTWYMLPEMMDFYKILLQYKPDSVFLFITRDDPNQIYAEARQRNISKNHIRIQPATRGQVPALALLSHASLFFIKPVWSKKASSPTKLAELMGMGIPVFTNSGVGDVDEVIRQNPLGFLIEGWNSEVYQNAITSFLQLKSFNREMSRQIACENFSLEKGISTFAIIYKEVW